MAEERFSDFLARQNAQHAPGRLSARYLCALASGDQWADREKFVHAQKAWADDRRQIVELLNTKAVVSPSDLGDAAFFGPLRDDFLAFLRPLLAYSRLPGIRRGPLKTRLISGSTGAVANFIAPNSAKPLTAMQFSGAVELVPKKVVGASVITTELSELGSPDSEALILGELARACAEAIDEGMFDPSLGISSARPAAITHSASGTFSSSGVTAAAVGSDLRLLLTSLGNSGSNLRDACWVMRPSTASFLVTMPAGPTAFASARLGRDAELLGLPLLITANSQNTGSTAENFIALIDGSQILLAEGAVELNASRQGTVQLSDSPSSTAAAQVSLWQNNLVGLKAEIFIDFRLRSAGGVAVLTDVAY